MADIRSHYCSYRHSWDYSFIHINIYFFAFVMKICKCLRTASQIEMWLQCFRTAFFCSIGFMYSSEMVCLMSGRWNSFQIISEKRLHFRESRVQTPIICVPVYWEFASAMSASKNRIFSQLPFSINRILLKNEIRSNWCFPLDNFECKNK